MQHRSLSLRGHAAGVLTAAALTMMAPSSAQAAIRAAIASPACAGQVAEQPFLRWIDLARYVLMPNGNVESLAGWQLEDGAAPVAGNEPFYVHDADDAWSLSLPPGSSAMTERMCVGVEHPTVRLFARNGGAPQSALLVEVLFRDFLGQPQAVPIGVYVGTSRWAPTPPLAVTANLLSVLPGDQLEVAFRFTPQGDGDWAIDDVYVDPFRHG
jgi:hypothetical protein